MTEIILIFLVVLLLFGAKRLPEIGASLGKGIREFKGSLREIENELKVDDTEPRNRTVKKPPVDDEADPAPRRLTSSESRPQASSTSPGSSSRPQPTPSEGNDESA